MTNSTKKGVPATATPSNSNACKCTACHCQKQATQPALFEMPQPAIVGGGLVDYLRQCGGVRRETFLATVLGTTTRDIRRQAQHSDGAVIFNSDRESGGLVHADNADAVQIQAFAADIQSRMDSLARRKLEVLKRQGRRDHHTLAELRAERAYSRFPYLLYQLQDAHKCWGRQWRRPTQKRARIFGEWLDDFIGDLQKMREEIACMEGGLTQ